MKSAIARAGLGFVAILLLFSLAMLSCSTGKASNGNAEQNTSGAPSPPTSSGAPIVELDEYKAVPDAVDTNDVYDREVLLRFEDRVASKAGWRAPSKLGSSKFVAGLDADANTYRYRVPESAKYEAVLKELNEDDRVLRAAPNYIARLCLTPNDPKFNPSGVGIEDYNNQWGLFAAGADRAWNVTTGSEEVVVAVVDTGCDLDHSDLVNQLWINEDEIPGNGVDDDANGYIDDINGFDFYNYDSIPEDESESGYVYHGTSCAGIIGASMNNGIGVASVAGGKGETGQNGVRIMVVRAGCEWGLPYSSIIDSLHYAADNGADIVSMSFGGHYGDFFELEAMLYASQNGCLLFASSGNEFPLEVAYPAAFDCVVAVGATTLFNENEPHVKEASERVTSFSCQGPQLELTAPGFLVVTTFGNNSYADTEETFFAGTSAACPFAAGCAALVKSYYPGWTADMIRQALRDGADDLGLPGFDHAFGYGRVNIGNVLGEDLPPVRPKIEGTLIDVDKTVEKYVYKVVPFDADSVDGMASINATATLFDFSINPNVFYLQANKASLNVDEELLVTLHTGASDLSLLGVGATIFFSDAYLEFLPATLALVEEGVFTADDFELISYFDENRPYELGVAVNKLASDAVPFNLAAGQAVVQFRFRAKASGTANVYFQLPECGFTTVSGVERPADVGYIEVTVR